MNDKPDNKAPTCNGCVRCCLGDAIRLLPGDNPDDYKTVPHYSDPSQLMLEHNKNGDCIYLSKSGCKIHEHKPIMCKGMDCRVFAQRLSYTQARRLPWLRMSVYNKGRELARRR